MDEKITVVIADDEEYVRIIMKKILNKLGCTVVGEAEDGDQAIKIIKETKPDIVLLDVNMPNKTGDEVLQEIRCYLHDVMILILTQQVDQSTIEKFFDLGVDNFIRKDYMANQIEEVLAQSIEKLKK